MQNNMMTWQTKRLGDVAGISASGVDKIIRKGEITVKLCNYMDVYRNGSINHEHNFSLGSVNDKELQNFSLKKGQVIITKDSETPDDIARSAYVEEDLDRVVCGYHLFLITPDKRFINGKYLKYYFDHPSNHYYFYKLANGVTRFGLTVDSVNRASILIPDLAEQERIVGVLEAWDEYLEKLERKIKLKQIAKNYIARKIFNNNSFVPLKNIASKRKNAIVDGPFGSQMKVSEFVSCGVPVIEMHHLNNNAIDTNKITRFVEVEKFEKDLRRSSVKAGDIVISKTGSLGYVGLYLGKKEAVMTSRLAKITIDKKKADVDFILEYLSFIQQLKHWERVGQGGTMKILSIKHLESLPVPDVDVGMQEQLGGIIKTISFEIQFLKSKKSQIEQQKKFLLKKIVSGELRTPEDILEKGVSR